ncbi:MAG: peptidase M14 [Maribacter sp.]|nr:MAG: peptidase M14 [Maribacter sp.]
MEITQDIYNSAREKTLKGRYITLDHIVPVLDHLPENFKVKVIGHSVNRLPIHTVTFGSGNTKILMWSQMHGNESTTTKAVFDLFNLFRSNMGFCGTILKNCTIMVIPMLNPDGARAYTRTNANKVDLNRDAQDRGQPESIVLHNCYRDFEPDYCFNLHGQRTIFNVGNTPKPATVSFLAPAFDEERNISTSRLQSMRLIAAMNEVLQNIIPGQIGRYDDGFNTNCVGDTFQMQDTPTVLFEAGHYADDYDREHTRRFIFMALFTALQVISEGTLDSFDKEMYFGIPDNNRLFYDILVLNAHIIDSIKYNPGDSIGLLFKEILQNGRIVFVPYIEKSGNLENCFGHKTYDCSQESDLSALESQPFWNLLKC